MAEFNWDEQIKTNLDKVVEVLNNSEATSSKGSTEIARLLTDADKRKAKVDAQQEARELSQKAREEKQQQALDKLTGFGHFAKKMQLDAAKKAKMMAGKVKDFAVEKIAGIKKAAGSLLDILMKGLGLLALWALFKWIQSWDIEAMSEAAKKVAEVITSLTNGLLGIGAWIGVDRIVKFFTGTSPTGNFIQRIKDAMKNTWMGRMATRIKDFFDIKGKDAKQLTKWQSRLANIQKWFKESWLGRLVDRIKLFFGQKGSGGKLMTKVGNLFTSIAGLFGKIPGLTKILNFVKGAAKFLGRIFVPVTVIMSLWEAVSGFMTGFAETEGNLFQKIMGGIGGAIKSLLDFFVFGIAEMVQDVIIWLLELFGFDGAATAVGDFNLVGFIKEKVFAVIDWFMLIFQDPMAAMNQLWATITGGAGALLDLIWNPLKKGIAWVMRLFGWDDAAEGVENFSLTGFISGVWKKVVDWVKSLFAWGMEAGQTEDGEWSIMKFVNSVIATVKGWVTGLFSWASSEDEEDSFIIKTVKNAITAAKEWLGKMFKFDSASDILASAFNVLTFFPNLIKDALLSVTEWLLNLFGFGEEAKAVANAKNFSIGDMIVTLLDKLVTWLSELFDFDIKKILADSLGALGDAGKKVLGWLGFGSDEEGDSVAMGGPVGAGAPVLVGEHGPELFVPSASGRILPKAQTETAMSGMGGGAPTIINAPTSNVSNGSSTVAMPSSSLNPMNDKYFRN